MDRNFDIDNLKQSHFNERVIAVSICGYINQSNQGDNYGNPPNNHWAAFLERPDGGSIRLDMAPGYGSDGLQGKIEMASKDYANNAIKTLRFLTKGSITVQGIVDLIIKNGRQEYTFTEEEEGCRYWIYTFVADLQAAGIIPAGSDEEALLAVSQYWRYPTGSEPRPVQKGTFR